MKNQRLAKNKHFLCLLSDCKKIQRRAILSNASRDQIYSICECILNVCNGNLPLDSANFKKLRPFRSHFRTILDKRVSLRKRKQTLVQHGGFLQFLIPAVISGLAQIISTAINSNKNAFRDKDDASAV